MHHFNLGRRIPGFDYGPDGFGTGLTPLHLSDDGEDGTFHFHDPPPPYTAYKYPDLGQPDDPPPPYEASINPDSMFYDPAGGQSQNLWTKVVAHDTVVAVELLLLRVATEPSFLAASEAQTLAGSPWGDSAGVPVPLHWATCPWMCSGEPVDPRKERLGSGPAPRA